MAGFLLQDCRWLFLGPGLLSWIPFRSRHCCEEPGRVLVWIVIAATVTKVVEGCVYLRRRYYAIFGMLSGGEFENTVLRSPLAALRLLSSNTTTSIKLIRPRGSQRIRAWTLRTWDRLNLVFSRMTLSQSGFHVACLATGRSARLTRFFRL